MANHDKFNHHVWRAVIITVALGGCLIFGIIVLISGDWLHHRPYQRRLAARRDHRGCEQRRLGA